MSEAKASVFLQNLVCQVPGRTLLQGVNLRLLPGQLYLLYGANGAGKSTLFKLLAGLLDGQAGVNVSGQGEVLGKPLLGRRGSERALLGYMPQQGGLYEELTVADNLRFRADVLCLPRPTERLQAHAIAHGLQPVWAQTVGQLSGGWRQRVAFAAAVLAGPRLLLLDEPTAGVDLEAKAQLWRQISALRHSGACVLVSSHDTEDAVQCEHLIALSQGKICYQGTPAALAHAHGAGDLVTGLRALLRVGQGVW